MNLNYLRIKKQLDLVEKREQRGFSINNGNGLLLKINANSHLDKFSIKFFGITNGTLDLIDGIIGIHYVYSVIDSFVLKSIQYGQNKPEITGKRIKDVIYIKLGVNAYNTVTFLFPPGIEYLVTTEPMPE